MWQSVENSIINSCHLLAQKNSDATSQETVFTAAHLESCTMEDDGLSNSDSSTDSHSSANGDVGTQLD